jgi:5-methylcytosine-specific restriction enzyme A
MTMRLCSNPDCHQLHEGKGKCPDCRRAADASRRPQGNPYGGRGHRVFREGVLARDPRCVCPVDCGTHAFLCGAVSTVADHYPIERVDLVAMGLDPNAPSRGRGLCKRCHDAKTARTRPSGWNTRD